MEPWHPSSPGPESPHIQSPDPLCSFLMNSQMLGVWFWPEIMSPYLFSFSIPKHTFTHAYAQTHVHIHTLACKNTLTNVHVYICTLIHTHSADSHECLYVPEWRRTGTVTSCTTVPVWILQIVLGSRRNRNPDTRSLVLTPLHCSLLNYVGCKSLNPLGQVSSPARWRRGRGLNPLGVKT